MLRSILSSCACEACRYCCRFNACDAETFTALALVPDEAREGWYRCAHLSEAGGCTLSDGEKPFACRLWPLFVAKREGRLCLMLATDCPAVTETFRKDLNQLLADGLEARIRAEVQKNRDFVFDGYDNAVFWKDL